MNRENSATNARGPISVLTVVLVMTSAVLAGLGWFSYRSYDNGVLPASMYESF